MGRVQSRTDRGTKVGSGKSLSELGYAAGERNRAKVCRGGETFARFGDGNDVSCPPGSGDRPSLPGLVEEREELNEEALRKVLKSEIVDAIRTGGCGRKRCKLVVKIGPGEGREGSGSFDSSIGSERLTRSSLFLLAIDPLVSITIVKAEDLLRSLPRRFPWTPIRNVDPPARALPQQTGPTQPRDSG